MLLSGDGSFEDSAGNNLDGEPLAPSTDGSPSGDGSPGGDYVVAFFVDGPVELNPFERVEPLGSLIDQSIDNTGLLHDQTDVDDYSVFLQAGETLTAELIVDSNVTATIEIIELAATATAGVPGATSGARSCFDPQ